MLKMRHKVSHITQNIQANSLVERKCSCVKSEKFKVGFGSRFFNPAINQLILCMLKMHVYDILWIFASHPLLI